MKIIIKHILRNIFQHWVATLLIILSLAMSCGVVYLAFNLSDDLLSVSKSLMKSAYGGFDLVAYASDENYKFYPKNFKGINIHEVVSGSAEAEAANGILGKHSAVFLVQSSGDIEEFCKTFMEQHPQLKIQKIDERIDVDEQMKAITIILTLVICMTVALSFFIIKTVTSQLLEDRKPVIAAYRSIGAGRRQTGLVLLGENLVYGFLGGILGILVGEIIRNLLIVFYFRAFETLRPIRLKFVLLEIAYSIVLQITITSSSLIKSSNLSIRSAIIRKPTTEYELSLVKTYIGGFLVLVAFVLRLFNKKFNLTLNLISMFSLIIGVALFLPLIIKVVSSLLSKICLKYNNGKLFLSSRNLFASKTNVGGVILCCMVTSLIIVISSGVKSVDLYFKNYAKNYPYDIFIKGIDLDASEYDFSEDIEDVGRLVVEYWDYGNWKINGEEKKICIVKEDGYSGIITMYDKTSEKLLPGHAIIDSILARSLNIKVGDTVNLFYLHNSTEFDVVIDSMCDSGYFNAKRTSIIVSDEDYFDYVKVAPAIIGVVSTGKNLRLMLSRIENWIHEHTGEIVKIQTTGSYLYREMSSTRAALWSLSFLPICVSVIALIGIINNELLTFKTKKREFSVFNSFGVSRNSLKQVLVYELVEVYLLGSLIGVPLGKWICCIFSDIVYSVVAYINIKLDFVSILGVIIIGLLVLLLASYPVIRKIDKINITEEIRYE